MDANEPIARLRALCASVGFDLDHACASLVERMRLLAEQTETVVDAERMAAYARAIFRWVDAERPAEAFDEAERRIVVLGCVFSDVGKTGPVDADATQRELIVAMFSVENVRDDTMPVARFLEVYFPDDAEERTARFSSLGLDPTMPIRRFWNLHGGWTLDIAESAGLPVDAVAAAATHHLLEGVNPQAIVGDDLRFTRAFGDNVAFDRAEKLVILIDKYDAVRRRGGRTHEEAIAWLRALVAKNPRFRGNPTFESLIADTDAALGPLEP